MMYKENQNEELLKLINQLVNFMHENGYNYFLIAGKDEVCSRFAEGNSDDLAGMISGFMHSQPQARKVIDESMEQFVNESLKYNL